MIAARLTLTACLLLAAANAHPHHQLLYSTGYQSQAAPPSGYYYAPQADAASVSSVQRYAAPVPVGLNPAGPALPGAPQYVLLYPGGGPQNNFVYGRDDVELRGAREPEEPNIWNLFNLFQRPTTTPKVADVENEVTTVKTLETTPTATATVATTVEETTPKSSDEASAKPEKLLTDKEEIMIAVPQSAAGTTDEQKASLENLDENLPQAPQFGAPPVADGRQFTLVQRPQFFGNYDFLNQANMHQRFGAAPPGAVSNFLLFRNGFAQPGAVPTPVQPGRPLKQVENIAPAATFLTFLNDPAALAQPLEQPEAFVVPGSAALAFQQDLNDAQRKEAEAGGAATRLAHIPGSKHVDVSQVFPQGMNPHFYVAPRPQQVYLPNQQVFGSYPRQAAPPGVVNLGPGYQNVFLVGPGQGVVVEADSPRKDNDGEKVEAEQAGPSVAQAKPQAIALAGVGGVASASPVATAVVGPGGLAVSAPTATAVAGPSGGGALIGPAQAALATVNKHVGSNKVKTRTHDDIGYDYTYEENRRIVQ